jgi:hypothetical protein
MIVGLLLVPACVGAVQALWLVLRGSEGADATWVAVLSGAACWVVIYLLLPKPMWAYVFGHELTHVVWVWALGGKIKKFKASSEGGHVVATKTNFVIALSPYFFPLYAFAVVTVYCVGDWLWHWRGYAVWFHLLLGAAYAFHLTLTWHVLKSSQSDITSQGYVFSTVIIFLGNMALLLVSIPLLTGTVPVANALAWWWHFTREIWSGLYGFIESSRR